MRKISLLVSFSLPLACLAQSIERPTPRPGDECRHDIIDNLHGREKIAERRIVVTSVVPGRVTMSVTHRVLVTRETADLTNKTIVYDEDLNAIEQDGIKFAQPYPRRIYPLQPETRRENVEIEFPGQTGTSRTEKQDARAGTWETRTVPAGSFPVLTLVWKGWYNSRSPLWRWSGRMQRDIAFSPATWCEISSTEQVYAPNASPWTHRDFILTSFKQGKDEPKHEIDATLPVQGLILAPRFESED